MEGYLQAERPWCRHPRANGGGGNDGSAFDSRCGTLHEPRDDGSDEHAPVRGTVEVAFALDGAIVLALRRLELDADPVAGREGGLADEADDGGVAAYLDEVADEEVAHWGRRTGGGGRGAWEAWSKGGESCPQSLRDECLDAPEVVGRRSS